MSQAEPDLLFVTEDLSAVMAHQSAKARLSVDSYDADRLLNTPTADLVNISWNTTNWTYHHFIESRRLLISGRVPYLSLTISLRITEVAGVIARSWAPTSS